jgi:hypothetical protein
MIESIVLRRWSHTPAWLVGSAIVLALTSCSGNSSPHAVYHLDVVHLKSLRLGLVGLSGDFTSSATERPARLLVTTNFGARFDDVSPPAARVTRVAIRGAEPATCLPTTLSVSFASRRDWWVGAHPVGRPVVYRTTTAGRTWQARQIAAPHSVAG